MTDELRCKIAFHFQTLKWLNYGIKLKVGNYNGDNYLDYFPLAICVILSLQYRSVHSVNSEVDFNWKPENPKSTLAGAFVGYHIMKTVV